MVLGGIAGRLNNGSKQTLVEECFNYGTVTGNKHCGGIIGQGSNVYVNGCINTGLVAANGNRGSAGILASVWCGDVLISNCANIGNIGMESSGYTSGGIYGGDVIYNKENSVCIYNCYNFGDLNNSGYIGGIAGRSDYSRLNIQNCYSTGNMQGALSGAVVRICCF